MGSNKKRALNITQITIGKKSAKIGYPKSEEMLKGNKKLTT